MRARISLKDSLANRASLNELSLVVERWLLSLCRSLLVSVREAGRWLDEVVVVVLLSEEELQRGLM